MQFESQQKYSPLCPFLEIIFLTLLRMKLISVKKETKFKSNVMSDTQFYFSWFQMFHFLMLIYI